MPELVTAIENVYLAFSDVPKPYAIGACPCCIDDLTLDRLVTVPLRQVSAEDLSPYASSAFLTAGDVDDYLYFLPRILEVTITDDIWWPDIEVTGRAIRETKPSEWSVARREVVQSFFESVFESFLAEQYYHRIDEWICGAARASFDVEPLLRIVETSVEAMLEFFNSNSGSLHDGKLRNAFWENDDPGQDLILEWLNSEKVRGVAFDAYGYNPSR
jgi:hypothetical protein